MNTQKTHPNNFLLPSIIHCPYCSTKLKLEDDERRNGFLICPSCLKEIQHSTLKLSTNHQAKDNANKNTGCRIFIGTLMLSMVLIYWFNKEPKCEMFLKGYPLTKPVADYIIINEAEYYSTLYGKAVWEGVDGQEGLKHMYVDKLEEYLKTINPQNEKEALVGIHIMNQSLRSQVNQIYN